MLGWSYFIYKDPPVKDTKTHLVNGRLAYDGLDWIKPLVDSGEAIDLGSNGYPDYYKIKVKHLKSFLKDTSSQSVENIEKLSGFSDDDYLYFEGWDLS